MKLTDEFDLGEDPLGAGLIGSPALSPPSTSLDFTVFSATIGSW